ncbi:hypothetical protein BT96DRAFT_950244 [Gymnopus androsaceus JB14]|uniref:Uncharacterized protein n=1 Tax=Gymnopus androsaceus JB14 TaxID=1447944 RepID=A0A6A4GGY9_9AGAR|nr:hypothetical protein BT96DRAFT_950244 [Gymnopus androsaceus JB14]
MPQSPLLLHPPLHLLLQVVLQSSRSLSILLHQKRIKFLALSATPLIGIGQKDQPYHANLPQVQLHRNLPMRSARSAANEYYGLTKMSSSLPFYLGLFQLHDVESIAPSESSNHLDLIDLSQEEEGASEVDPAAETDAEKLAQLRKTWTSTVYAFYKEDIKVIVKKGQRHHEFTCAACGAEVVHWVSESLCPFAVVKDRALNQLMKTGQPEAYVPSPSTVAQDTKTLFEKTCTHLANKLQQTSYRSLIGFGTSVNGKPLGRYVQVDHKGAGGLNYGLKRLVELYLEKRDDNDEEEFEGAMEWYKKTMATQTAEKLSCFGWIVDAVSVRAVAFGGDPLYVAMKDANRLQLKSQSVDYGTMIHSQLMLKKQGGVALDPAKQGMVNRYLNEGTDKVVLRGLLKDIWLHSLHELLYSHIYMYTLILSLDYKQMKWGSAFADLCYEAKVKLINYPVGMKAIGPPGGIQGSANMPLKYVKEIVKQYVQFWQQEAREQTAEAAMDQDSQEDSDNEQQKVFFEDLVQFVPWDDDDKEKTLRDQANIGILLQVPKRNSEPLVLAKVLHLKKFIKRAGKNIEIDIPEADNGEKGDDSEDENKDEESQEEVVQNNWDKQVATVWRKKGGREGKKPLTDSWVQRKGKAANCLCLSDSEDEEQAAPSKDDTLEVRVLDSPPNPAHIQKEITNKPRPRPIPRGGTRKVHRAFSLSADGNGSDDEQPRKRACLEKDREKGKEKAVEVVASKAGLSKKRKRDA